MSYCGPKEIWSGAQTGADRGGLIAAFVLSIPTGGWVPKGGKTENGWLVPELIDTFHLTEHWSSDYPPRTKLNVEDTDATIWFGNHFSRGGKLTIGHLKDLKKPFLLIPFDGNFETAVKSSAISYCTLFLRKNKPNRLNIAGNRESKVPGIETFTMYVLINAILKIRDS